MEKIRNLYRYRVNKIKFKSGQEVSPGRITIFVGANNCGKTQTLKEMLGYITGKNEMRILLASLDVSYPESWDALVNSYPIDLVPNQYGSQYKYISPTLDADPIGSILRDVPETVNNSLNRKAYEDFRSLTGARVVTFLNTENRLKLVKMCNVRDLYDVGAKNVLEALYLSGRQSTEQVCQTVRKVFKNTDVYFDYSNPGVLQFRTSKHFGDISKDTMEAYSQLKNLPKLDDQGDGIRSFVGMICALVALDKPIILLDEPEAFLHPPQAYQLGEILAKTVKDSQQIFISTHSVDFLKGLVNASQDTVVVRITRSESDMTEISVLDTKTLNEINREPLLSSSRVLDGLFYKGVVVTEADADSIFYQRLFQKIGASDEIHFMHTHNKQTLKKVVDPYQKLGVRFALVADADVIREYSEFNSILKCIAKPSLQETILGYRQTVYNYVSRQDELSQIHDLRIGLKGLIDTQVPSPDASKEELSNMLLSIRTELKKMHASSDNLSGYKSQGREAIEDAEVLKAFDILFDLCSDIGLFIVPVGELESWLVDYGIPKSNHKNKWITNALPKLQNISYDPQKNIWKFVDKLKDYLTS